MKNSKRSVAKNATVAPPAPHGPGLLCCVCGELAFVDGDDHRSYCRPHYDAIPRPPQIFGPPPPKPNYTDNAPAVACPHCASRLTAKRLSPRCSYVTGETVKTPAWNCRWCCKDFDPP